MPFTVSPGIVVSEIDQTASPQQVSVSGAAFAGPFQWGPALELTTIGSEDVLRQTFGGPDDTIASYWFSAQSFLAYSNLLTVVRAVANGALNATASTKAISGTVDGANGAFLFTSNTGFSTTGLLAGQTIVVGGNTYTVNATTNATAFTVTSAILGNVSAQTVNIYGVLITNEADYNDNFATGISGFGAWSARYAGELGNSIQVSACPSANAFANTAMNGSLTLTAGSNTVTGTTTTFSSTFVVGDYLTYNTASYQVVAIASNTSMTVSPAPTANLTPTTGTWGRKWQFANLFDSAPTTSDYANLRGATNDEMHVVVVDVNGKFTGTPGTVLERYRYLSKASDGKDANGQSNYYKDIMNAQSNYVWSLNAPGTAVSNWGSPVGSGVTYGGDAIPSTMTLMGGQTQNATIQDGDLETAYDLFQNTGLVDIALIISGPASTSLGTYIVNNIAETRLDCVAFLSPQKSDVVNNSGQEVTSIVSTRNSLPSSSYAFFDSNWKYQYDKYNNKYRWVPLNGDIAGLCARTDTVAQPWFSPAGFTRGNIKNWVKLAWNPIQQVDRDNLYSIGCNPVVSFPAQGVVLFGDKTLLNRPSAFDRINVRRLFIVLEKTIARLAQSALFEFNDDFTRGQFRNIVNPYLSDVKAQRGIGDYRVVCDTTNNTDTVVAANQFVGDIYIKPNYAINFIALSFVAVASGVSFQEVSGIQQ